MKRPLFLIGFSFLLGALLASFLSFPFQVGLIFLSLVLFLFLLKVKKEVTTLICGVAFIIAVCFYTGYRQLVVAPLEVLDGQTLQTTGKILSVKNLKNGARIKLQVREVQGQNLKKFDLDLFVFTSYEVEEGYQYQPGEIISAEINYEMPRNSVYYFEENYYGSKNTHLLGDVNKEVKVIGKESEGFGTLEYHLGEARDSISRGFTHIFGEDIAGVISAIVLGDKSLLGNHERYVFNFSGIAHILAMSGLHITIVAGIFLSIFLFFKIPRKFAIGLTLIFMFCYCVLGGLSASLIRATIMTSLYLGAEFFGRQPDSLSSWGLSGMVLVIFRPMIITTDSFQLSFVAALVILLASSAIYKKVGEITKGKFANHKLIRGALTTFLSSALITVFSIPFTVYHYGTFTLISCLTNIFAIPLVTPILIFGLFTALCLFLGLSTLASFIGLLAGVFTKGLILVAEFFAIRPLTIGLDKIYILLFLTVLTLLGLLFYFKRQLRENWKPSLLFSGAAVCISLFLNSLSTYTEATFLPCVDEGQGSLLLQYQDKTILVVNTPSEWHLSHILKVLNRKNVYHIDLLIFTEEDKGEGVFTQFLLEHLIVDTFVTAKDDYYKEVKEVSSRPFDTEIYKLYDMDISLGDMVVVEIEIEGENQLIRTKMGETFVDIGKGHINPKLVEGASLILGEKDFLNEVKNGMIKIELSDRLFYEFVAKE